MLLFILYYISLGFSGAWLVARKGYSPLLVAIPGALSGGVLPGLTIPLVFVVLAALPRTREARRQAELEREMDLEASSDSRRKTARNAAATFL